MVDCLQCTVFLDWGRLLVESLDDYGADYCNYIRSVVWSKLVRVRVLPMVVALGLAVAIAGCDNTGVS